MEKMSAAVVHEAHGLRVEERPEGCPGDYLD